jgi:hypothetical protein
MPDDSTPGRPDLAAALAEVSADTGWHCWQGVIPMLYASRPQTSPPVIVRAPTPEALRDEIGRAEAGRQR